MKIKTKLIQTKDYLLLIDEEAEIKPDDYIIHGAVEGVIEANDEWHYRGEKDDYWNKVIAYYPLTKEAKELDLPLLPNPFREVDVEELSEKANGYAYYGKPLGGKYLAFKEGFIEGYKAAQSKGQYSLEDIISFAEYVGNYYADIHKPVIPTEELLNSFIQSLSTQQLPKEFVPEYEYYYHSSKEFYKDAKFEKCSKEQYESIRKEIPTCPVKTELKTMTNSEGREELVGTYKY